MKRNWVRSSGTTHKALAGKHPNPASNSWKSSPVLIACAESYRNLCVVRTVMISHLTVWVTCKSYCEQRVSQEPRNTAVRSQNIYTKASQHIKVIPVSFTAFH